jgi:hypothetical protein
MEAAIGQGDACHWSTIVPVGLVLPLGSSTTCAES